MNVGHQRYNSYIHPDANNKRRKRKHRKGSGDEGNDDSESQSATKAGTKLDYRGVRDISSINNMTSD